MMARGAAPDGLDATVAGIASDATTASELFAVVDLIDGQPMLRRSLSDPSASFEERAGLAKRLFDGCVRSFMRPENMIATAADPLYSCCCTRGWSNVVTCGSMNGSSERSSSKACAASGRSKLGRIAAAST